MSSHWVPGTVLRPGDAVMNKPGSVLDNRKKGTGFRVYTVCPHQKTMKVSSTKRMSNKRARNIQNTPKT